MVSSLDVGFRIRFRRMYTIFLSFPQSEVAEQRTLAESYRAQLLSLEAELDTLREVSAASKDMLKVSM